VAHLDRELIQEIRFGSDCLGPDHQSSVREKPVDEFSAPEDPLIRRRLAPLPPQREDLRPAAEAPEEAAAPGIRKLFQNLRLRVNEIKQLASERCPVPFVSFKVEIETTAGVPN
jgi:hypothetical protein